MTFKIFLAVVLLFAVRVSAQTTRPIDVWIDADTSMGVIEAGRVRDVDDGIAMILAFHSPELKVHGVSVVFGNCSLENAMPVAAELLKRVGPEGMVAMRGSASGADFGVENEGTRAMAAELEKRPMHILALGPLTNVGTVLKNRPELAKSMLSVLVVAGRRPGFDFHPPGRPELKFPDANFEKDIPATQVLIDSKVPVVFAGYESSCDTWLTRADMERLAATGPLGQWVATSSEAWLARWETRMGLRGFNPFDALAVSYLTHPELFTTIPVKTHITSGPDDRHAGRLVATRPSKHYWVCEPVGERETSNQQYITMCKPEYVALLMERLAAKPK